MRVVRYIDAVFIASGTSRIFVHLASFRSEVTQLEIKSCVELELAWRDGGEVGGDSTGWVACFRSGVTQLEVQVLCGSWRSPGATTVRC